MKTGAELIAAERERQKAVEGWTPEHDAHHTNGELARAAARYAVQEPLFVRETRMAPTHEPRGCDDPVDYAPVTAYWNVWPWDSKWYKPKDRLDDLVRAGALIAAEIDRIHLLMVEKGEAKA